MRRREFLAAAAVVAPAMAQPLPWSPGAVLHILPTVSHNRALLKISLAEPLMRPPELQLDTVRVTGERNDLEGLCWEFDAVGLDPDREYRLTLADAAGNPLCDPWTLSTFPAPGDAPRRLRVLF